MQGFELGPGRTARQLGQLQWRGGNRLDEHFDAGGDRGCRGNPHGLGPRRPLHVKVTALSRVPRAGGANAPRTAQEILGATNVLNSLPENASVDEIGAFRRL